MSIRNRRKGRLREDRQNRSYDAVFEALVRQEVEAWTVSECGDTDIVVGAAGVDEEGEEKRILVDFAVRRLGTWGVAEVWIEEGELTLIHDLGAGLPPVR
jgi:hypothetical protein